MSDDIVDHRWRALRMTPEEVFAELIEMAEIRRVRGKYREDGSSVWTDAEWDAWGVPGGLGFLAPLAEVDGRLQEVTKIQWAAHGDDRIDNALWQELGNLLVSVTSRLSARTDRAVGKQAPCPTCGRDAGQACHSVNGRTRGAPHGARLAAVAPDKRRAEYRRQIARAVEAQES